MRSRCLSMFLILSVAFFCQVGEVDAQKSVSSLPVAEAIARDMATWRALLANKNYDDLEKIALELRTQRSKYRNGRGRDWRFYWIVLADNRHTMKEEDFQQQFPLLEDWLKAKPDSVAARLMLAHLWHRYGFFARGSQMASMTTQQGQDLFAERNKKASTYLDEIAQKPEQIDNVYRRLRMEIAKGLGEKPSRDLVFDGLAVDPLNMELVHGMSICLLPRWFGEPGELEEFADEVVQRTEGVSGKAQYVTVVVSAKEFAKAFVLESHPFDMATIRQGFRDLERIYPQATEFLDDEAQLEYLAGDVPRAFAVMQKIGEKPRAESWREAEINFDQFRKRVTPQLLEGDQTKIILGATDAYLRVESVGNDQLLVGIDGFHGVRMFDFPSASPRGWVWIQNLNSQASFIHGASGVITGGVTGRPGAMLYSIGQGKSGAISTEKKVTATCLSNKGVLAVAEDSGKVTTFDLRSGKSLNEFTAESPRFIMKLAFSPDEKQLAAGARKGELIVFELEGESKQNSKKVAEGGLRCLDWSEQHLAVGTGGDPKGGEVIVLDQKTLDPIASWRGAMPGVTASIDFSPDGKTLAIGRSADNSEVQVETALSLWHFEDEKSPQPLRGHLFGVNCVRFTEQGKTLVSGSNDWTIRYWKVQ